MGDTWIINMSHYDYKDEGAQDLAKAAIKFAEYFASIIEGTVHRASIGEPYSGVRCRRRPQKRACDGVIRSELSPEGTEMHWWCPVCGNNEVHSSGFYFLISKKVSLHDIIVSSQRETRRC